MRIVRSKEELDDEKAFWLFSPSFFQSAAEVKQQEEVMAEPYEANPPFIFASNKRPSKRVRFVNPPNRSCKKIRKSRHIQSETEKKLKVENGKMMEEESVNRGIFVDVEIENGEQRSRMRKGGSIVVKMESDVNVEVEHGGSKNSGAVKLNRWSKERYTHAWEVVVKLLKENVGPRLMRGELREKARKHIGDTGLLDHLLKHMVGKVVGDGGERFMRGCNEERVMFYWLESAGGEHSQSRGGFCRCSDECAAEINRLNEGITTLNRDLEELRSSKESNNNSWKEKYDRLLDTNMQLELQIENMKNYIQGLKDEHAELLDKNAKLESEMEEMSSSYQGAKSETVLKKDKKCKDEMAEEMVMVEDADRYRDSEGGDKKNEHTQLHDQSKVFGSSQMKHPHLNLTCQGQAKINCLPVIRNCEGDLPQLPSSSGSDLITSLPILG